MVSISEEGTAPGLAPGRLPGIVQQASAGPDGDRDDDASDRQQGPCESAGEDVSVPDPGAMRSRGPTAEAVWRRHPGIHARSAGTSTGARHPGPARELAWADVIFVMEEKHESRLLAGFRQALGDKPVHVLDIPGEYRCMDPELVAQLERSVAGCLALGQRPVPTRAACATGPAAFSAARA